MIRFRFIDGKACPFFCCEICGEPLTEPGWAMIAWDIEREESGEYVLYPIHKRTQAGRWCIQELERRIERIDGGCMGTAELGDFIGQLTQNSGFEIAGTVERWDGLGDLCSLLRRKGKA